MGLLQAEFRGDNEAKSVVKMEFTEVNECFKTILNKVSAI